MRKYSWADCDSSSDWPKNINTESDQYRIGKTRVENIIDNQRINISHLSKGVYQIKIQGKDWLETRKLIIE